MSYVVKYKGDAMLNKKILNFFDERFIFVDSCYFLLKFFGSRDSFYILKQMFSKLCKRNRLWIFYIYFQIFWHCQNVCIYLFLLLKIVFVADHIVEVLQNSFLYFFSTWRMWSKNSWISNGSLTNHDSI